MSVNYSVLQFLEINKGKYVSGNDIALSLGVSRNAVWKAVNSLKSSGYEINAVPNKGYMLSNKNNIISAQSIKKYISDENIRVKYYDSISSTNTVMKEYGMNGEEEGLLIVASEQTAGRGRRGKNFVSPLGTGIYFSLLLRPVMAPKQSLLITTCAAVAVADAIEQNAGIETKIKWVNDIYKGDRKICGILTEAAFDLEGGSIDYAVLGIGINIYYPEYEMPEDIRNTAGSVFEKDTDADAVSRIVADCINNFMREYRILDKRNFLDKYRSRSYLTGKKVDVIKNDSVVPAEVLGIDDDFRLNVRYENGSEEFLSSGEVSTRPSE